MADWTPPRTWEPGEALTASELNTHIRDNMTSLRSAAAASMGMLSNPSVPASTFFTMAWEFAVLDTIDVWQPSPHPERATPARAGFYLVTGHVRWSPFPDGGRSRVVRVMLNGQTNLAQDTRNALNATHNTTASCVVFLNGVGDYVTVQAWHNSDTAQQLANNVAPTSSLSLIWLGA